MQFNTASNNGSGSNDGRGEKLVTRYIHTANPEFHIQSADFTTGILTLSAPHGLTGNTQVMVAPNYTDLSNYTRDIRSIPMEWIKPQGVAISTNNTGLGFVVIDEMTVKIVKSSDFTTALTVNLTSTENNNNVDITKFHFETPIAWSITNLPRLKKFKVRSLGYVKYIASTGGMYRYTNMRVDYEDGTSGNTPYINFLGLPSVSNSNAGAGTYLTQDWVIDATSQLIQLEFTNIHWGRRAGYNTLVWDGSAESVVMPRKFFSVSKPFFGITEISSYGDAYAYMGNGTIIEIWDMGVMM